MNRNLIEFLCRAKKSTYAGKEAESIPSRPNSHDLAYKEKELTYIDSYLGSNKFAGEEAIWENENPIWAMNYVGRVVAQGFSGDFLKEVLLHVSGQMPFRGPLEYKNNGFIYKCTVNGDFDWFQGQEEILYNKRKIYECVFHGGSIIN